MNKIACTVEFTNEEIDYLRSIRPGYMLLANFLRQVVLKDMPQPPVEIVECQRCHCPTELTPQFSSCFCWCHQLPVAPPPENP